MTEKERYQICCNDAVNPLSWDIWFLLHAAHLSSRSKDPSTKAGAIIIDSKRRIVGEGYNGFPRGVRDTVERLNDRETKYDLTIHAEINAMSFSNKSVERCTIYVYPLPPCVRCAVQIAQNGITRVVAPVLPKHLQERWGESVEKSRVVFSESLVEFTELDVTKDHFNQTINFFKGLRDGYHI